MQKLGAAKVRLGFSVVQKAKIRYSCDYNLFKMPKSGTTGDLYCLKC